MKSLNRWPIITFLFLVPLIFLGLKNEFERSTVDGFEYVAVGGASLEITNGVFVIDGLDTENAGVSINVDGALTGDIHFDPVPIPVGGSFSARAIDATGDLIADFELWQANENSTDIWLNLGENTVQSGSSVVEVFARSDSGAERRVELPAAGRVFVGTVTAPTAAWARTYHWLCGHGECHLIIDPDETVISFASEPGVQVPFQYLGVVLQFQNVQDQRVGSVELGSLNSNSVTGQ